MKSLAILLLLAAAAPHARAEPFVEGRDLIRPDGQPVYCGQDDGSRKGSREKPIIDAPESDRKLVSALQAHVLNAGVQADSAGRERIELTLELQLVSCVRGSDGKLGWVAELADPTDSAEAVIPTGLFDGLVRRSPLERKTVVTLGPDAPPPHEANVARFSWPLEQAAGREKFKEYARGNPISLTLSLRYLYEKADSPLRPSFPLFELPFSQHYGEFPASFNLTLRLRR